MKEMERKIKASDCFSERDLEKWHCDGNTMLTVRMVSARSLLCPGRIDLICKLYYIECRENNRDMSFARRLYLEHIRVLKQGNGDACEDEDIAENCFARFDQLIDSVRQNGFEQDQGVIAVDDRNVVLEGAHRTAIAIYYDIPIPIVTIQDVNVCVDPEYLALHGLEQKYLDFLIFRYICWKGGAGIYLFCLWPVADQPEKLAVVDAKLRENATIIYRKEIDLNYLGVRQFMVHLYREESWSGCIDNGYRGIHDKAISCYRNNAKTTIYFIENVVHERVLTLKQETRDFYHLDIHSTHSSDTSLEALDAARMLLNQNSIHLLNHGSPFMFRGHMKKYVKQMTSEDQAIESTLALYGIQNVHRLRVLEDERTTLDPEKHLYYLGRMVPAFTAEMLSSKKLRMKAHMAAYKNALLIRTAPVFRRALKGVKDVVRKVLRKIRRTGVKCLKRTSIGREIIDVYRSIRYGMK